MLRGGRGERNAERDVPEDIEFHFLLQVVDQGPDADVELAVLNQKRPLYVLLDDVPEVVLLAELLDLELLVLRLFARRQEVVVHQLALLQLCLLLLHQLLLIHVPLKQQLIQLLERGEELDATPSVEVAGLEQPDVDVVDEIHREGLKVLLAIVEVFLLLCLLAL